MWVVYFTSCANTPKGPIETENEFANKAINDIALRVKAILRNIETANKYSAVKKRSLLYPRAKSSTVSVIKLAISPK